MAEYVMVPSENANRGLIVNATNGQVWDRVAGAYTTAPTGTSAIDADLLFTPTQAGNLSMHRYTLPSGIGDDWAMLVWEDTTPTVDQLPNLVYGPALGQGELDAAVSTIQAYGGTAPWTGAGATAGNYDPTRVPTARIALIDSQQGGLAINTENLIIPPGESELYAADFADLLPEGGFLKSIQSVTDVDTDSTGGSWTLTGSGVWDNLAKFTISGAADGQKRTVTLKATTQNDTVRTAVFVIECAE